MSFLKGKNNCSAQEKNCWKKIKKINDTALFLDFLFFIGWNLLSFCMIIKGNKFILLCFNNYYKTLNFKLIRGQIEIIAAWRIYCICYCNCKVKLNCQLSLVHTQSSRIYCIRHSFKERGVNTECNFEIKFIGP